MGGSKLRGKPSKREQLQARDKFPPHGTVFVSGVDTSPDNAAVYVSLRVACDQMQQARDATSPKRGRKPDIDKYLDAIDALEQRGLKLSYSAGRDDSPQVAAVMDNLNCSEEGARSILRRLVELARQWGIMPPKRD